MLESLKQGASDEQFVGFFRKYNGVEVKETDPINEYMILVTKFTKVDPNNKTTPQTGTKTSTMIKFLVLIIAMLLVFTLVHKKYLRRN